TTSRRSSPRSLSTGTSTTRCGSRPFADETLLTTAKFILAFRDQHHAAARPRVRPPDHFYDHNSVTRDQREPDHSLEHRENSRGKRTAGADDFHRSQRIDSI